MKYLKQFEGYDSSYYEVITLNQWDEVSYDNKWISIDTRSFIELKSVLEDLSKMNPKYEKISDSEKGKLSYSITYRYGDDYDEILMGLADDIVYIWYIFLAQYTKKDDGNYTKFQAEYYKCDQIEGVFQLLKDKEIMR